MKSTKELAKELGLLRKRQRSVTSPDQHKNKRSRRQVSRQIFHYIIVLDFESTCWSNTKLIPQEIIEFPAVLMNTSNGEIESQFHSYVQPTEKPILSEFCCQLTGISQEKVDDGIPLQFCLKRFSLWLENLFKEKNIQYFTTPEQNSRLCTFVTWSDWDLGLCLKNECRRKQLRKPPELNQWIDLRATYKKFYERKPNGLNGALNDLGITFQGREHSGLDDARNTARLAWRMIKDGCVLTITKRLSGPRIVGSNQLPGTSTVIKEMPTLENGPHGTNIPSKKTLARNEDSKTHSPVQTTSASINKKNSPNRPKTSKKNIIRKRSELLAHSENPQPSSRSIRSLVSGPHEEENSIKINNNLPVPSNSILSKGCTVLTSSPQQKQSSFIQVKKRFSVYTDNKISDTNIEEDFEKDLSPTYELNKNVNNNKTLLIPTFAIKDISNGLINQNSLTSDQKLEISTKNETPSFTIKDNSNAFTTPNYSNQKLGNSTKNQTPSFTIKENSNAFIFPNSSDPKLGKSTKNKTPSFTTKDNSNAFITPNSSNQKLGNSTKNQTPSFTIKDNSNAFITPNSSNQKLGNSTKNQTPYFTIKDNSNAFITPNSYNQKFGNSTNNQTPSFTLKENSNAFITPNSLPLKSKILNHSKVMSMSSSGIKDVTNVFITPNSLPPKKFNNTFKSSYPNSHYSKMKSTPPLCKCGRRAKLCISHTPGANMGRKFFTCGLKGANSKCKNRTVTACNFFKWELDHQSRVSMLNCPLHTSFSTVSLVSNSTKENKENQNSCPSFLKKSPVESTPILKRNKVRPYQLSI